MIEAPSIYRELHHVCDLPDEFNLEAFVDGAHDHALNQSTQYLDRFRARRRIGQSFVQVLDLAAVDLGEVGVQAGCGRRRGREVSLKGGLASFNLSEPCLQTGCSQTVCNGVDQAVELTRHALKLLLLGLSLEFEAMSVAVDLPGELGDELFDVFRLHQVVLQGVEDQNLKHRAANTASVDARALPTASAAPLSSTKR